MNGGPGSAVALGLLGAATVVLAVAACLPADPGPDAPTELVVAAAASLRAPLVDAAAEYEIDHPSVELRLGFDSSATLRAQIEEGAPVDVFLSADESNPVRLADMDLAAGAPRAFAANGLAIVVPATGGAVSSARDLAADGVRIVAAGDAVPITLYATELVANLARQPGYPADFAARYASNVVSHEDNVTAVVAKIALGEGDAGIVYRTDAAAADDVVALALPAGVDVVARYSGIVVADRAAEAEARAFLDWLAGPDGQAILAEHGFEAVQ